MTREEWLIKAVEQVSPIFESVGFKLPSVKVSVGWPGGKGPKSRVIGQHWHPKSTDDNVSQIFISPVLKDGISAIDVLMHELVHAVYPDGKHGKTFTKLGRAVGLTGKPTSMGAGEELKIKLQAIVARIGDYPHSGINVNNSNRYVQPTALKKCQCDCGYTLRITMKWVNLYGAPLCPNPNCLSNKMKVEE